MDFGFNDEYKMIQKMYREFAEKEIKPLAEEIDENERFPKESVQKMADNGMLGIPFPEEYGGEEGDYLSYVIAVPTTLWLRPPTACPAARSLMPRRTATITAAYSP